MENIVVPSDTAQVILANCKNCSIKNLNLSDVDVGIILGFSSYNSISGNNIGNNNCDGILLHSSSDNSIVKNKISNNNWFAIEAFYSSDNSIAGNNISNNRAGVYLEDSSNNIVKENNFIDNNRFNAWYGNYWDDWQLPLPRSIYGTIHLERFDKDILWFNFDWHPAREPYDIS